jgi:hypothetical protein
MNQSDKNKPEQNDYLWDATGAPDPQIQRLEHALQEFRSTLSVPPVFPRVEAPVRPSSWWAALTSWEWTPRLAAMAAIIVTTAFVVSISFRAPQPANRTIGWDVQLTTAQSSDSSAANAPTRGLQLHIGETFETDQASKASIAVANIGRLELEPNTRLRLLQSAEGRKRVALDRGTIHAAIWAPPGEFVLDTPSAVAVDLGCMYTLTIDEAGGGLLRTTLGWVGFQSNGRESFIPAGAASVIQPHFGPGTPYFEDASNSFRNALSQFDSDGETAAQHAAALQIILREARSRDGFTLWHLLSRVNGSDRSAVYDRLAALVPPPSGVARQGILRLDRTMLDFWWNAFDLGDIGLWRHWERSWAGQEN